MEQEFETAESIQKWLIENRNVPPSVAAAACLMPAMSIRPPYSIWDDRNLAR